jgi:polar amino acid transport system substrate-binding protein
VFRINSSRRSITALALAVAGSLAVTACNEPESSSSSTGGETASGDSMITESWGLEPVDSVAALVPEDFKSEPINNAIYNDYPPEEFLEGDTLVGIQPDMVLAMSEVMGVELNNISVGSFDSIIPGTVSGRYDMSSADFGVTAERLEQVDFVTMFRVGTAFGVKKGSDLTIDDATDLCGHTVGVQTGSYYIDQLQSAAGECEAAGKEPIKLQTFPNDTARTLAVTNGRIEVTATSQDALGYQIQSGVPIDMQDFVYEPVEQAMIVPKGSELGPALQAAMKEIVENGTYVEVLEKWGVADLAYSSPDEVLHLTDPSQAP